MADEHDRLIAAFKGDKIAQEDGKFWFMLQNLKEKGQGTKDAEIDRIKKILKDRFKGKK